MCGSKHSANWTTSRPSLLCSYSLLSNVLALFPHYTRSIKKETGWRRCQWFMVFWVCVRIFACGCMHSLCVGHVFRCAVYLTRISNISLPHPGFVFVQNESYSWQSWLHMWVHLRNAPSMLYSTPCTSKCRGLVWGSHFCHHHHWTGSSNHTSSITMNGLPIGITFPQWATSKVTQ